MQSINELAKKYFLGTISPDEEKALYTWLMNSESNASEFRSMERKWQESHLIPEKTRLSLGRAKLAMDIRERQRRSHRRVFRFTTAAAVVAAVLCWAFRDSICSLIPATAEKMITCAAPLGSKTFTTLADGTSVWLNAGSSISYSTKFNRKERHIILDGEAYFEVARNEQLPFSVESGNCCFTVLGTRFNISSYREDNSVQVVLVEGSLKFDSSGYSDIMKPGDLIIFKDEKVSKKVVDPRNYCSWVDGFIRFDNILVPDFIKRVAREYNVNIKLKTDKFDNTSFRASFSHNDSVVSILETLCVIFPMELHHTDDCNFFIDAR